MLNISLSNSISNAPDGSKLKFWPDNAVLDFDFENNRFMQGGVQGVITDFGTVDGNDTILLSANPIDGLSAFSVFVDVTWDVAPTAAEGGVPILFKQDSGALTDGFFMGNVFENDFKIAQEIGNVEEVTQYPDFAIDSGFRYNIAARFKTNNFFYARNTGGVLFSTSEGTNTLFDTSGIGYPALRFQMTDATLHRVTIYGIGLSNAQVESLITV